MAGNGVTGGSPKRKRDGYSEPVIKVVGVGGGGSNSIKRLRRLGLSPKVETIAINTDIRHLGMVEADKKVLIGKNITRGHGAGGKPEMGEQCAEQSREIIREMLEDADLVFITAGMGGGTGTGAAPVVADIAKQLRSIVISMTTIPFRAERGRMNNAVQGLEHLRKKSDSVVILDNNKLLEIVPDLPVDMAFSVMDQMVAESVKGITEVITEPSLINLDYADLRTVMSKGATATVAYGEDADDDPQRVVLETLNNPLLDVDYAGATGALIHITLSPDTPLKTANSILETMTYELDPDANIIYGVQVSHEYEGKVKIMSVLTGVQSPQLLSPTQGFCGPDRRAYSHFDEVS
jgi:cell division protein FtsZ